MATATKPKPVETKMNNAEIINRDKIWISSNPRKFFAPEKMAELRESIRQYGIFQPLIVVYDPSPLTGQPYRLKAGERRYRASETVLEDLPCIVISKDDEAAGVVALIENLQRENLTAIEEAEGVRDYMEARNLSARAAARDLNKSMGWIQKRIELLRTGEDVQAVAARNPYVMSSLLLIDGVKDKSTRADLLNQVESGAAHSAIKSQVESYQESQRQTKAQAKQSTHAPDTQTHQRLTAFESNGTPNYSRGLPVVGTKPSDAKQTIETALLRMETDFKTVTNFWDKTTPAHRKSVLKRLETLRKRFGELS